MAMVKGKSIGITSESTPIQRPHLCTFVTLVVSIVSMTSKLTFLYTSANCTSARVVSTDDAVRGKTNNCCNISC